MSSTENTEDRFLGLSKKEFLALPFDERVKVLERLSQESVKKYANNPEALYRDHPHLDFRRAARENNPQK